MEEWRGGLASARARRARVRALGVPRRAVLRRERREGASKLKGLLRDGFVPGGGPESILSWYKSRKRMGGLRGMGVPRRPLLRRERREGASKLEGLSSDFFGGFVLGGGVRNQSVRGTNSRNEWAGCALEVCNHGLSSGGKDGNVSRETLHPQPRSEES